MTEQATDAATPAETETVGPQAEAKPEVDWKAKAREWEKRAKANADAAQKLAELEESQKTEAQKLQERAEAAERQRDELLVESLRARVALVKGLSPELAERLRGSTEAELLADADALLALIPATPARPRGDVDQGARAAFTHLNDGDGLDRAIRQKVFGT